MATTQRVYQRLAANIMAGDLRTEELEGRKHYVAPTAMMAEGVWNGSEGPIFYPADELSSACPAWNYKPVVVYHPEDSAGNKISACDPNILNTRKIGVLLNTRYDGKQRTECWIDIERAKEIDNRVIEALEAKKQIEGSTGLLVDKYIEKGTYNEQAYDGVARNHRPDHYAILPDQIGAYSVQAGGGVLTVNVGKNQAQRVQVNLRNTIESLLKQGGVVLVGNELSFDATTRQLADLLSEKFGQRGKYWGGYIIDTFDGYVVFRADMESGGDTFKIKYTISGNTVSLSGDAIAVERTVEYRATSGAAAVGNSISEVQKKGDDMAFDRKAHIDSLIGNGWEEIDRANLEKMEDGVLAKILPTKKQEVVENKEKKVEPPAPTETEADKDLKALFAKHGERLGFVQNKKDGPEVEPEKKVTLSDILANSTDEARAEFSDMQAAASQWKKHVTAQKEAVVGRILANKKNRFKKEFLMNKSVEELQGIAELLPDEDAVTANGHGLASYMFNAGVDDSLVNNQEVKPLVAPTTDNE